ncbi:MAG TPA: hypothetical protein VFP32_02005 [Candidatus Saccharimonadales bacterium]|nr:hypothetical protein [Candidatus Saccharimonadales bacterium]
MSAEQAFLMELQGREAIRSLAEERAQSAFDSGEVDRRTDAANDIVLLMVNSDEFIVRVQPVAEDELPFEFKVPRHEALDAYKHPYAYIHHIAA